MSKILSIIGKKKKNCWKEKWEEKKQNRLVPNQLLDYQGLYIHQICHEAG